MLFAGKDMLTYIERTIAELETSPEINNITRLVLDERQAFVKKALISEKVFNSIKKRNQDNSTKRFPIPKLCNGKTSVECLPSKYRMFDGKCNNPLHPEWGAANSPFQRLLEAENITDLQFQYKRHIDFQEPLFTFVNSCLANFRIHITPLMGLWGQFIRNDIGKVIKYSENELLRSLPSLSEDCLLGPREQLNVVTSFLDASPIYGSSSVENNLIREWKDGKLKSSKFETDFVNTLLIREHNQLADSLKLANFGWSDEALFQEARRIIIAIVQHVTFKNFLPLLINQKTIRRYDLILNTDSGKQLLPSAVNSAVTVAFRIFDFLLPLSEEWNGFTQSDNLEKMRLLASILNEEKDHGIPSYLLWRKFCNLSVPQDYDEMQKLSKISLEFLKLFSPNIKDLSLFLGGVVEKTEGEGIFGPTFSCIGGNQFSILKYGDNAWYENSNQFSNEQLESLKKMSIVSLLCDNLNYLENIQPNPFIIEDKYLNAPIPCKSSPRMDIDEWRQPVYQNLSLSKDKVITAFGKAIKCLDDRTKLEISLLRQNNVANKGTTQFTAHNLHRPSIVAIELANTSLLLEYASKELAKEFSESNRRIRRQNFDQIETNELIDIETFGRILTKVDTNVDVFNVFNVPSLPQCELSEENQNCDPSSRYRSFSGRCNNLVHPDAGAALEPFIRLLPSKYDDGLSLPRSKSATGIPLPSPRLISTSLHADVSNLHKRYSLMLMQFGQFIDHDITLTPVNSGFREIVLDCTRCDSQHTIHPECYPIPVPDKDSHFQPNFKTGESYCIPLTRSLPGQRTLGPREQMNQNTAVIDASTVYGSEICEARFLRSFINGKLNSTLLSFLKSKEIMPKKTKIKDCESPSGFCFAAGDTRASEQPGLACLHTIFLRYHNLLAEKLAKINSHWNDEKIYQEVRKILGAIMQHLTYSEFLPRVLGWNSINAYGLDLKQQGYYFGYDSNCYPSALNEFGTAAFRFGHSLIRPFFSRMSETYEIRQSTINLRGNFNNPDNLYQQKIIDEILRGIISTPMENMDQFVTSEVTNHLFEKHDLPFKGEHGIPPYNEYRQICKLSKAKSFEDLSKDMSIENIHNLKSVYASVDDIDLFTGGLLELPLQGGLVGPTFGCIIGLQFRLLKKCDRFWYESPEIPLRFSESQLSEIRKSSLSHIFCESLEILKTIQRKLFDLPHDFLNPRIPCEDLPALNLNAWKETPPESNVCTYAGYTLQVGISAQVSPCTRCACTNKGLRCYPLSINSCQSLLIKYPINELRADNVCRFHCKEFLI